MDLLNDGGGRRISDFGEDQIQVGGVRYRRGATVRLVPGPDSDPALVGRTGYIDGLHRDANGRAFLLVCLEEAPGDDGQVRVYLTPAEVDVVD